MANIEKLPPLIEKLSSFELKSFQAHHKNHIIDVSFEEVEKHEKQDEIQKCIKEIQIYHVAWKVLFVEDRCKEVPENEIPPLIKELRGFDFKRFQMDVHNGIVTISSEEVNSHKDKGSIEKLLLKISQRHTVWKVFKN